MPPHGAPATPVVRLRRIAVAGNPNCGKTTVFNALTGLRHHVANYPGVTVEKREGRLSGSDTLLVDLPGTYSLSARSPDEEIARDVLLGRVEGETPPDAVLIVLDATNLERNLYLASQILDLGLPTVIACNMMDAAGERRLNVDCERLTGELGCPVVPTVAMRRHGLDAVRRKLEALDQTGPRTRAWRLPAAAEEAVSKVARVFVQEDVVRPEAAHGAALLWAVDCLGGDSTAEAAARRFLAALSGSAQVELCEAVASLKQSGVDLPTAAVEARYAWIGQLVARCVTTQPSDSTTGVQETWTDLLDRFLTHRVFGLAAFAGVMFVLFLSIFSWAEPLMGLIESGQAWLSGWIVEQMAEGPLRSLITDGVINGVGSVLVFFPQICILFLCLGLLEDSGYMARAAFLMDRLMSRVGLHGKSFIPLLSSYACAIPGIMATRTIENRRDRFTTIMVAPLMSCSARLPVYIIVIAAVFGGNVWLKAGVMFGMYALGTAAALLMALIFKKTLFRGPRPAFIMELPPYHLPRPMPILRGMWDRSKLFLTGAGTTIFAICIIIWALSYFPRVTPAELSADVQTQLASLAPDDFDARDHLLASAQLRQSYIGRLGAAIEPALRPLGFDWRLGIGILTSFLAREVFVGTMGITFAVGDADETSDVLRDKLAAATWPDGRRVLTPLTGIGLLVFYVLACQCVSTLAVTRRETNSWRWPAFMFGYMSVMAYVAALVIYQVGSRL